MAPFDYRPEKHEKTQNALPSPRCQRVDFFAVPKVNEPVQVLDNHGQRHQSRHRPSATSARTCAL